MMVAKANRETIGQAAGWARRLFALFTVLLSLFALLLPSAARADFRQPSVPVAVVGPVTVSVPSAGQVEKVVTFTPPAGVLAPFTLVVQNGVGLTIPRVAEGTVWLDDVQVAGLNDFRKGVSGFTRNVEATAGPHTIKVVLRGRANSGIRLTLLGRKLLPIPVAAAPSPLEVAVNATAKVAVTLSPAPTSPGNLKAFSLSPFKATVPLLIPFAAGQTEVLVPVRGRSAGTAKVTVLLNLRTLTIPVNVVPAGAKIASLTPPLATLNTGGQATVTVALHAAQPSAVSVALSSSPTGRVSHPASVSVPAGATQASFTIQGLAAGSGQLTASVNGSFATSQFSVLAEPPGVAALLPVTNQIAQGASASLTLSLTETVSVNTAVNLTAAPSGIVAVPASVTVPAGASQTQVPLQGLTLGTASVRAELNGTTAEAAVQVTSPPVEVAELLPPSLELVNGAQGSFTLRLNTAQIEAVGVGLVASPDSIVSVPASVTVPAGALETNFQVQALAIGQTQLTASLNGKSKAVTVNVIPEPLALVSLLPADLALQPGAAGSVTLTANAAQPQAVNLALAASPADIVQVPASVTLPAGQTSVQVPVTALAEGQVTITASANNSDVSTLVSVTSPPPVVAALTPLNASTPKGRPVSLTVKLDRVPSQPQTVALASSATGVASVPASVTVPAGNDEAVFAVTAAEEGQAQISASLNGTSAQASLTVTPAEVVAIALSPIDHTAYIGDRVPYSANAIYTDASQRDVTNEAQWSSGNETVATIDATGHADAIAVGSAQIATAALNDVGQVSASQTTSLTVLTPPSLSLAATKTTLKEGESVNVSVTSAVAADDLGLEISVSGGGTGGLQIPASVTIPAGQTSASFIVTGQSIGQYSLTVSAPRRSSASLDFTIVSALDISITGISPTSGEPGSVVTIQGSGFDPVPANNAVIFFGNATAPVIEASATTLKVKVPATAQTGAITLTTSKGTVTSSVFTVIRQQDFALTASPASQVLLTSGQAVYSLALSSLGLQNFTGLASLKVSGLPAGVTAKFSPTNLALNQAGSLILTAASNASIGSATITVEATALVSGVAQTRTAQATVNVQSAVGVTGVKGRFVTPEGLGIAGVRVNVDANQTVSDAAGNFLLTNLPAGKVTLRMDATPAHPLYPIWPAIVTLETGKLTVLPDWPIIPPPADDKFTPIANAAQDQAITDPRYPGVAITLPAGVTITGWDGVVKSRMAVERVQPDKLGVPMPPVPTKEHYQLYFGTPMGGVPSQPIPVTLPNVAELEPGAKGEIWYFDGSPMGGVGEWKLAGSGTVSADGATITTDPGKGIPRFCGKCGLFAEACPPIPQGPPPPDPCTSCPCDAASAEPIEYYSGHEKPQLGGLACGGRTPIAAGLSYSPVDAFQLRSGLEGAVGQGWVLDYDIVLAHRSSASKRILLPPNVRIDFTQQPDGSYATSSPAYAGAVLHLATGGSDVWELTRKDGSVWRFGQSDLGTLAASFLTEIVDPQGNATQITRRADHKITAVGTAERSHTYHYGSNDLVDSIADPAGRSLSFTYNAARRIETATDADGKTTAYTYVDDTEYPASPVCTQGTDGLRIKTIQYPGITTITENFHGSSRRVLKQTSRLGETRFAYTVTGACITHVSTPSTICAANCPNEDSWEAYQDGWRFHGGQVIATRHIEPSGREITRRFNAKGIVLEKIDPDGVQSTKVLDAQNRVVLDTDLLGRTNKYAYDASGNIISQQDPLGRITDTQYDPKWNAPTSTTRYLDDGSPVVSQIQYHAANGQPVRYIDPENRQTTYAYTQHGQLQSEIDPLNHQTLLTYNPAGDLVEVKDPLGNITRLETDGAGRIIKTTTPKGYDWNQSYNGNDQPRIETDPQGGKIERVYDEAGRLVSIWNQNGHAVETYAYDGKGNLASRTDAKNQQETYQYDSANRLTQTTTRKGEVVAYAYDGQDRLTQISRPDSTTDYSYDAAGRLIQIQEGSTRLQYEYDQVDRLTREVQDSPNGFNSVEYQYDVLDRRISRKVNGADETKYVYNKASQLTQIQYRNETTSYQYDAAGRLASKTLPGGITQTYVLDTASRPSQTQYKNGATLIDQLDLQYDAEGNIVSKKLQNGSLKQDSALTASYDNANRMTQISVGGKTYALSYDNNGNLTNKQNTTDATDTTAYTWDTRNRLTAISAPGTVATFQYDPLGRRIERSVNGVTTSYLYDGNQAIGEVRNNQATTLLTGLNIDEAIARYASTGRLTQLTDQLGSVIKQINEAGSTQSATSYSPYGEASATGDDQGNSTEYTARENDGTGLYFYRARYYDPVLKRFISEDPIGSAGGVNFTAYVGGDPLSYVDPYGLSAKGDALKWVLKKVWDGCKWVWKKVRDKGDDAAEPPKKPSPKPGSEGGPGAGKDFPKSTKDAAREESGEKCVFCGKETTRSPGPDQSNIDHAIPKSRNGNNSLDNAQNTCRTCNLEKSTKTTGEYMKSKGL